MELKRIEKASKYLAELKEIDEKVLSLEKLANQANDSEKLLINLQIGEQIKKEEKQTYTLHFGYPPLSCDWDNEEKKPKKEVYKFNQFSEQVDIKHFYMFCQYLLNGYNKRREFLINKLQKL